MSLQREELLLAGRKKLKEFQRRKSLNTNNSSGSANQKTSRHWRHHSLIIHSCNDLVNRDDPAILTPASTVASPTSLAFLSEIEEEDSIQAERYPSPPLENDVTGPPVPCPTASTPSIISNEQQQQRRLQYARHERSQSMAHNYYSKQFPTTWEHARRQSPQPLGNLDEALIWIQQNNRLVQENERLKRELNAAMADKARLKEMLAQTEHELQALKQQQQQQQLNTYSMARQDEDEQEQEQEFKKRIRCVHTEERARWSEIVDSLEQEIRQLRLASRSQ